MRGVRGGGGRFSNGRAGWAEGARATSRWFHEAVFGVNVSLPAGAAPAFCCIYVNLVNTALSLPLDLSILMGGY
jgi:hypothetical protein